MNSRELAKEISSIYNDYPYMTLHECINMGMLINCKNASNSKLIELGFMDFDGTLIKCTTCGNSLYVSRNNHYSCCDKCSRIYENNKGE